MNEQLKKLYQSVILKYNNEPYRFEKREAASHVLEAYNQICGDRFKLFFDLEDGKIARLCFHGFGCAISKASTSVLIQNLEGKTLREAQAILNKFLKVVGTGEGSTEEAPADFQAFSAAKAFPGRLKCATLSWDALGVFLEDNR